VRLHLPVPSHPTSAIQSALASITYLLRKLLNSAMIYIFTASRKSTQITSSCPSCSTLVSLRRLRHKTSQHTNGMPHGPPKEEPRRTSGLQDLTQHPKVTPPYIKPYQHTLNQTSISPHENYIRISHPRSRRQAFCFSKQFVHRSI
jgi:hypothetical protein